MGERGDGGPGWPFAADTMLGKYRIVRLVGEGGMGAVYEAVHLEIGKRVAIKAMNPTLAAIPEARARFVREAQVTSRVRHPHVIDVTDIESEAGHPFMVMEYLEGEDLARHILRRGPLPIDETADIALPLLAAVEAAHAEGIVHRDLKPQNIFLAEMRDGTTRPTVLDFGISKAPPLGGADPISTAGGLLGSPIYFAPEQVNDSRAADAASDQYALGVILYECVTGRRPYEGSSIPSIFEAILRGHYFPARTHRPDLPEGFAAVIIRAMSIDPAARFPDLAEMGRALLPFASERARVRWADAFRRDVPRSGAGAPPRPRMPVTDQTPAPAALPHAVTVGLAERARAPSSDAQAALGSLSIPRRGVRGWALGGVAVAAIGLTAAGLLHARDGGPRPATEAAAPPAPAPASHSRSHSDSGSTATATATAAAPAAPVARPTMPRAGGDDDGAGTEAAPRPARQARRLRYGANRAPLIE